ncbi:MAG: alginate lyase family protein [Caldimonas sp.]
MTSPGTYWRTVRHLRAGQLTGRIAFRLRRPSADLRPAPDRRVASGPWATPARRLQSLEAPATFDLLGARHALADVDWNGSGPTLLWRYHQHYFDDLNAEGAEMRGDAHAALIERWLADNPPGQGPGWAPYPLSLRIVNWIKWLLGGHDASAAMLASLAVQTRWLAQRLETHLLGNHLFANAKALVFAGLFFDGAEAARWLASGTDILGRELPEQVLDDGGQFELSPMYHALALEDVLDLANAIAALGDGLAAAERLRRELIARIPKMRRWLAAMSHPDATLGRFNDCADGIAPAAAELAQLADALGTAEAPRDGDDGVVVLADSGYVRVERDRVVALIDVARVGPDYLPGHAHADTLSFELSLDGRRLIVNGGTSRYGEDDVRQRERSTAAHSTVEVAATNSSEVWAGFRVGRRARPTGPRVSRDGDALVIDGAHDGYAHLAGRPIHRRRWRFDSAGLIVEDEVGPGRPAALARFHLAPGLALAAVGERHWRVSNGTRPIAEAEIAIGRAFPEVSFFAPRFGVVEPTACLAVALADGRSLTRWSWLA